MTDYAMHFVKSLHRKYNKPLEESAQAKSVLHCSQHEYAQTTGLDGGFISHDPGVNSTSTTTFPAPK